jgi:hypothetical protein
MLDPDPDPEPETEAECIKVRHGKMLRYLQFRVHNTAFMTVGRANSVLISHLT